MENIVRVEHKSYGVVINTTPPPLPVKDEELWLRDPRLIKAKKKPQGSHRLIHNIIRCYIENLKNMKANIHLTVGRQRL